MKHLFYSFFLICVCAIQVLATNELTVNRPGSSITKPAYIDTAVVVIEPFGGYAQQSLYLTYSDHGGFQGYTNVQITHHFELPSGSVINDMWLWIGDSVVQAVMLDTWKAKHIYDSIVDLRRDPAYLFKNNDQYELKIFPLTGGSFRKVKINFITPVTYIKDQSIIELPIKALNANNTSIKPLGILFKYKDSVWGIPSIPVLPENKFVKVSDTAGYSYLQTDIRNTAPYESLRLNYALQFKDGKYFQSNEFVKGLNYFQYSISIKDAFNLKIDSLPKKVLVALDLSSKYNKNLNELIPNLKNTLKSAIGQSDLFNIIVAGDDKIKLLSDSWLFADENTIDGVLNRFRYSTFSDSIQFKKMPRLFYADNSAPRGFGFSTIDSFATKTIFSNLLQTSEKLKGADICVSYEHCFVSVPTPTQLNTIIANLDTFFINGGRFISYFNMDCNTSEKVVTHYIPSLKTIIRDNFSRTLYRNMDGNIGANFPEYFDHRGNNLFELSDQDVKVEIRDAQNNPAIISKKIGNGLLIACGFWLFNDDEPTRKLLTMAILGLNKSNSNPQILTLLDTVKSLYKQLDYNKILFISNSDSLFIQNKAEDYANTYLKDFPQRTTINSINLLNNDLYSFPTCTINGTSYLGSGYLLKILTQKTGGIHFERQANDWQKIINTITPYDIPAIESFVVTPKGNGSESNIIDFYEVSSSTQTPGSPQNFVGSTTSNDKVSIEIKAKFSGNDTLKTVNYFDNVIIPTHTTNKTQSTIIGNEKVKQLFQKTPRDTALIVSTALNYHLLCDFTALLALEPNDSIHFIHILDETRILGVKDKIFIPDSVLSIKAYPNPFNSQISFKVFVGASSKVTIKIYNILGEAVKTITENERISASRTYVWNTSDYSSGKLGSGVYFVRMETTDDKGKVFIKTNKIVLLK